MLCQPERVVVELVSVDRLQGVPTVAVEQLRGRHDAQSVAFNRRRRRRRCIEDPDVGVRVDRLTGRQRQEDERNFLRFGRRRRSVFAGRRR